MQRLSHRDGSGRLSVFLAGFFVVALAVGMVFAVGALAETEARLANTETITVSNTKPVSVTSKTVLDPAHRYRILAKGRISDWPNAPEDGFGVDALYCYAQWRCPGNYLWRQLRIKLADDEWGPSWGQGLDEFGGETDHITYNPAHVYAVEVTGVEGRLEFATWDAFVLKSHPGNKGAFTVEITDLGGGVICRVGGRAGAAAPDRRFGRSLRATIVGDPLERGPIQGTAGADVIVGTEGPDTIRGGGGRDTICGHGGNDTIDGGPGQDAIMGEGGRDTLIGGADTDFLFGGADADRLLGGAGGDNLDGGPGNDQLRGEAGRDSLIGGPGNDLLDGGSARDLADYRSASQPIKVSLRAGTAAGSGKDTLRSIEWIEATRFDDILRGSDGPDILVGDSGDDRIYGLGGADRLVGDDGDDLLVGGYGLDTANGGPGTDTCAAERRRACDRIGIAPER